MPFSVPDECVPYIRWQRSRFQSDAYTDQDVKREYARWVQRDYEGMRRWLPKRAETVLDIGCGMAGIDVLLSRHYPEAKIRLLDGDGDAVVEGQGYNPESKPYSSRALTEKLLAENGVKVDHWYDVGTDELLEADLIVSLASLGYHYPLSTYRLKGFVICDLRKKREFTRGTMFFTGPKYARCAFQA